MSFYRQFRTTMGGMLKPAKPAPPILAVCRGCGGSLCMPLRWNSEIEGDPDAWDLVVECPNCWHCTAWRIPHATIEAYDRWLRAGTDQLIDQLQDLTRANMEHDAEQLRTALATDLLLPEDFGRPAR